MPKIFKFSMTCTVHVLLVPWLSGVYGICITSSISSGFALGNTFNCMSGTNPYTPETHGTGYTRTLLPSRSMPAHVTSVSEAGNDSVVTSKLVELIAANFLLG